MKKLLIWGFLALFISVNFAQTNSNLVRRSEVGLKFTTSIPLSTLQQDMSVLALNYTHYFQQHGIILGISKRIVNSSLSYGQNSPNLGGELGYKYALDENLHSRWQPYAFASTSFFRTKSTYLAPDLTNYTHINYTYFNLMGMGLDVRLHKHLHADLALGAACLIEKYDLLQTMLTFLPTFKVGLFYQYWKPKKKQIQAK